MKRIALAMPIVLALTGGALAAGTLSGKFSTRISGAPSPQFNGVWTLDFQKGGKYVISEGKRVLITGRATFMSPTITFGHETGPAACKGAQSRGTYNYFLLRGKVLRFELRADSCPGRRLVLGHQFAKIG